MFHVKQWRYWPGGINENSKPDYQEKLNVLSETIMAIMAGEVNENCKSVSRIN